MGHIIIEYRYKKFCTHKEFFFRVFEVPKWIFIKSRLTDQTNPHISRTIRNIESITGSKIIHSEIMGQPFWNCIVYDLKIHTLPSWGEAIFFAIVTHINWVYAQINRFPNPKHLISFSILLNHTKLGLYINFSERFGTERISVVFQEFLP